jgi:hypothetical protein
MLTPKRKQEISLGVMSVAVIMIVVTALRSLSKYQRQRSGVS